MTYDVVLISSKTINCQTNEKATANRAIRYFIYVVHSAPLRGAHAQTHFLLFIWSYLYITLFVF